MPESNDELELLHTRTYDTTMYRLADGCVRAVGMVRDVKPAGMYIPEDPEPLTIHDMEVVLDVDPSTMTITSADVVFSAHPNDTCPSIVDHYGKLVGLSVARGFNRKVRELFGGPRGCTHTTALLQAMGPVVVQSMWSLRTIERRERGLRPFQSDPDNPGGDAIANLNTCHVWAEDGEVVADIRAGQQRGVPVWIRRRYEELGWDLDDWLAENRAT
ncbi:MAG: DUF2889 domain-containing protein [Actinomycetota bacterium]